MKEIKNRISLKETTHNTFSLMGYFSKSPEVKDIFKGSIGTLNYHDGIAEIELTPAIYSPHEMHDLFHLVENSKDAIIYGCLEDGTFVKLNVFRNIYGALHSPGFSVARYIAIDITFSKIPFVQRQLPAYDHLLVTYDSLNEFGCFVVPKAVGTHEFEGSPFLIEDNDFLKACLVYEWEKHGSRVGFNVNTRVEIEVNVKKNTPRIDAFIKNFSDFLSIINNSKTNITSVRYLNKDGEDVFLHLFSAPHTKRNGSRDYSHGLTSQFNFLNYCGSLEKITNNIFSEDKKFNRMIKNYLYNIDTELNSDSALINYVDAIDIYMNGSRYTNGGKINSLAKKIDFWLKQFPSDLYGLYFDKKLQNSSDEKKDKFIQSIVDTRDYLTHFVKANSAYLIPDNERSKYIKQLRGLIHIYILHIYGVPKKVIASYYREKEINRIS